MKMTDHKLHYSQPPVWRHLSFFWLFIVALLTSPQSLSQSISTQDASLQASAARNSETASSALSVYNMTMKLKEIQFKIDNSSVPFCHTHNSQTSKNFKTKRWNAFIEDKVEVLVYPYCLSSKEFGNKLGAYLNELACAHVSGVNFVTVHKQFQVNGSTQGAGVSFPNSTLIDFLPETFVHPNPVQHSQAVINIETFCKCNLYCWSQKDAPWVNSSAFVGQQLLASIINYNRTLPPGLITTVANETDFTNAPSDYILPIVPDVTIQYRCGDNIAFSYMYGILPFTAFTSRIPPNSSHIYVLSDHPSRAKHSEFTGKCHIILKALYSYLVDTNPNSIVVVKRGGSIYLDYVRMAFSKVLICSASTFCIWPALANIQNGGQVYYPLTVLIAGADNMDLAPKNLGPRFHWINDSDVISSFRKLKPWTLITDVLTGKMEMPK